MSFLVAKGEAKVFAKTKRHGKLLFEVCETRVFTGIEAVKSGGSPVHREAARGTSYGGREEGGYFGGGGGYSQSSHRGSFRVRPARKEAEEGVSERKTGGKIKLGRRARKYGLFRTAKAGGKVLKAQCRGDLERIFKGEYLPVSETL